MRVSKGKVRQGQLAEAAGNPIAVQLGSQTLIKINCGLVPIENFPVKALSPNGLCPRYCYFEEPAAQALAAAVFEHHEVFKVGRQTLPSGVASVADYEPNGPSQAFGGQPGFKVSGLKVRPHDGLGEGHRMGGALKVRKYPHQAEHRRNVASTRLAYQNTFRMRHHATKVMHFGYLYRNPRLLPYECSARYYAWRVLD